MEEDALFAENGGFARPEPSFAAGHSGPKVEKMHRTRPAEPAFMKISLMEEPTEVLSLTELEPHPFGTSPTCHRLSC